jgi:hypothetical protein
MVRYALDKMGIIVKDDNDLYEIIQLLSLSVGDTWYYAYDIFEYLYEARIKFCNICEWNPHSCSNCLSKSFLEWFPERVNLILEEEKSGYRMVDGQFTPITNEKEIESIEETIDYGYKSVSEHMKNALTLYSNRKSPNYKSSIIESIHAVESMCRFITGESTLGKALKKLKNKGVEINPRLETAFEKIYAYTNEEVRHGSDDMKYSESEVAKYMLVSCSAFVNYLIEKYSKFSRV